jgi:hypothetical protein
VEASCAKDAVTAARANWVARLLAALALVGGFLLVLDGDVTLGVALVAAMVAVLYWGSRAEGPHPRALSQTKRRTYAALWIVFRLVCIVLALTSYVPGGIAGSVVSAVVGFGLVLFGTAFARARP